MTSFRTIRHAFAFALLVLALACAAFGQTAIYIGFGPSLYTTAPYGAGNLSIFVFGKVDPSNLFS
jgi:hypothetical protein